MQIKVVPANPLNRLDSSTDIIIGSVAKGQRIEHGGLATHQAQQEASCETYSEVETNYFVWRWMA